MHAANPMTQKGLSHDVQHILQMLLLHNVAWNSFFKTLCVAVTMVEHCCLKVMAECHSNLLNLMHVILALRVNQMMQNQSTSLTRGDSFFLKNDHLLHTI